MGERKLRNQGWTTCDEEDCRNVAMRIVTNPVSDEIERIICVPHAALVAERELSDALAAALEDCETAIQVAHNESYCVGDVLPCDGACEAKQQQIRGALRAYRTARSEQ